MLDEIIWNYSWPLFPYIWNEIRFQVAYQSDLKFVAETMLRIVTEEIGKEMMERVSVYRDLLARTPVDELEVREHPRVIFRVDEMTWIDAIVRYLVVPREAGPVKKPIDPKTTPPPSTLRQKRSCFRRATRAKRNTKALAL